MSDHHLWRAPAVSEFLCPLASSLQIRLSVEGGHSWLHPSKYRIHSSAAEAVRRIHLPFDHTHSSEAEVDLGIGLVKIVDSHQVARH